MYLTNRANPEQVWVDPVVRSNLQKWLRSSGAARLPHRYRAARCSPHRASSLAKPSRRRPTTAKRAALRTGDPSFIGLVRTRAGADLVQSVLGASRKGSAAVMVRGPAWQLRSGE
jgi:hypothetical protein